MKQQVSHAVQKQQLDPLLKADLVGCDDAIAIFVMPTAISKMFSTPQMLQLETEQAWKEGQGSITYLLNQLT